MAPTIVYPAPGAGRHTWDDDEERERADVLQREALGRIEALSAAVSVETGDEGGAGQGDDDSAPQGGVWARLVRWWSRGSE